MPAFVASKKRAQTFGAWTIRLMGFSMLLSGTKQLFPLGMLITVITTAVRVACRSPNFFEQRPCSCCIQQKTINYRMGPALSKREYVKLGQESTKVQLEKLKTHLRQTNCWLTVLKVKDPMTIAKFACPEFDSKPKPNIDDITDFSSNSDTDTDDN